MYKRICVGYIKCGKDIWWCNQKFELGSWKSGKLMLDNFKFFPVKYEARSSTERE